MRKKKPVSKEQLHNEADKCCISWKGIYILEESLADTHPTLQNNQICHTMPGSQCLDFIGDFDANLVVDMVLPPFGENYHRPSKPPQPPDRCLHRCYSIANKTH